MLDTVMFRLTMAEVEGVDFLNETPYYLDPYRLTFSQRSDGGRNVKGYLDGLMVTITPTIVSINGGSLCKWMLGDNYQSLGRRDIKRAVERLSDTLHLPMERATITRLDIGASIPVKEPVCNYFNHLGLLDYAERCLQPYTLYYHRHQKAETLCFYDKNEEQKKHNGKIPDLYRGVNVLRYEQRYVAKLPRLLGVPQVTAAMLYDERFYISMLNKWREAYQAIRKVNDITINFQSMKTKKDLQRMGVLALAEQWGGELGLIAHINEAQKRGDLTTKQAYDLRQAVKNACKVKDGLTVPSTAISELDKKIAEAIRFYR